MLVIELHSSVVSEDSKKEPFDFQNLFTRNVVVDLEERKMRPTFFPAVMALNSSPNARAAVLRYTGNANVEHLISFLPLSGFLPVKDVNAASDVGNLTPLITPPVKATPFDKS